MGFEKSLFYSSERQPIEQELAVKQEKSEKSPRVVSEYDKTRQKLEGMCKTDSFDSIIKRMIDGIEIFAKSAQDIDAELLIGSDIEAMKLALLDCAKIKDQEHFLDAVMKIVNPIVDIKEHHKDKFEEVEARVMNEASNLTPINRLVSYGKSGDEIHIHHTPGTTVENKLRLYKEALAKLAEIVDKDPEIKKITAASWIVAKNPRMFTGAGFTVEDSNEYHKGNLDELNRKMNFASISRDDFLNRYLKKE